MFAANISTRLGAPAPSQAVLDFISTADYLPPNAPSTPIAVIEPISATGCLRRNECRQLAAVVSAGKACGGGRRTAARCSIPTTPQPLNSMFRVNRVSPFRLPWIMSHLGDVRLDLFIGRLTGQEFINNGGLGAVAQGQYGVNLKPQPFLSGGKISFKLTPNLEFNFSKTTIYGGPGNPLTPKTFLQECFWLAREH